MNADELICRSMPELKEGWQVRAQSDLALILAIKPQSRRWQVVLRRWWKATAAFFAVGGLTLAALLSSNTASAVTPPMLAITLNESKSRETMKATLSRLTDSRSIRSGNKIVEHNWALVVTAVEPDTTVDSYIEPEENIIEINTAGVDRIRRYVDAAYDKNGNPVQDLTIPAAGTFLGEEIIAPEDQLRKFPHQPPTDPGEMYEYFTSVVEPVEPSLAIDAIKWVRTLLGEWILTPAQESALVAWLADMPDLVLLGEATDRLGRPVVVFEAPLYDENQERIMINTMTGRIAGTETIYRGSSLTNVPSPAVIYYGCWE